MNLFNNTLQSIKNEQEPFKEAAKKCRTLLATNTRYGFYKSETRSLFTKLREQGIESTDLLKEYLKEGKESSFIKTELLQELEEEERMAPLQILFSALHEHFGTNGQAASRLGDDKSLIIPLVQQVAPFMPELVRSTVSRLHALKEEYGDSIPHEASTALEELGAFSALDEMNKSFLTTVPQSISAFAINRIKGDERKALSNDFKDTKTFKSLLADAYEGTLCKEEDGTCITSVMKYVSQEPSLINKVDDNKDGLLNYASMGHINGYQGAWQVLIDLLTKGAQASPFLRKQLAEPSSDETIQSKKKQVLYLIELSDRAAKKAIVICPNYPKDPSVIKIQKNS